MHLYPFGVYLRIYTREWHCCIRKNAEFAAGCRLAAITMHDTMLSLLPLTIYIFRRRNAPKQIYIVKKILVLLSHLFNSKPLLKVGLNDYQ